MAIFQKKQVGVGPTGLTVNYTPKGPKNVFFSYGYPGSREPFAEGTRTGDDIRRLGSMPWKAPKL